MSKKLFTFFGNKLDYVVFDGFFNGLSCSLFGGAFITGFAVSLGANNFQLGMISSLLLLCSALQISAVFILNRFPNKKLVNVASSYVSRSLWLLLLALPLLSNYSIQFRLSYYIVILVLYTLLARIEGVSWYSWMRDIVPEKDWGKFFAVISRSALFAGVIGTSFGAYTAKILSGRFTRPEYVFITLFEIGVVFGIISILFKRKVPSSPADSNKTLKKDAGETGFESLKIPFRDKNFLMLLFCSAFNVFADGLLAQTLIVSYLMRNLGINFSVINLFLILSQLMSFTALRIWGNLNDRFSSKPIIYLCIFGNFFVCFLWIATREANIYLLLPLVFILSGIFGSGMGLAQTNILLKLSPQKYSYTYISIYNTIIALIGSAGALLGGLIAKNFADKELVINFLWLQNNMTRINLPIIKFYHFHFLFLAALVFRIAGFNLIKLVKEPMEISSRVVIEELKKPRIIGVIFGLDYLSFYLISRPMLAIRKLKRKLEAK